MCLRIFNEETKSFEIINSPCKGCMQRLRGDCPGKADPEIAGQQDILDYWRNGDGRKQQ